jgi:hypothetical protein
MVSFSWWRVNYGLDDMNYLQHGANEPIDINPRMIIELDLQFEYTILDDAYEVCGVVLAHE